MPEIGLRPRRGRRCRSRSRSRRFLEPGDHHRGIEAAGVGADFLELGGRHAKLLFARSELGFRGEGRTVRGARARRRRCRLLRPCRESWDCVPAIQKPCELPGLEGAEDDERSIVPDAGDSISGRPVEGLPIPTAARSTRYTGPSGPRSRMMPMSRRSRSRFVPHPTNAADRRAAPDWTPRGPAAATGSAFDGLGEYP